MNTLILIRDAIAALVAAVVAALFMTACSDSSRPPSPTAPLPEAAVGTTTSRLAPHDRTIPLALRWVGDEHNRLVGLAVDELERLRRTNPSEFAAARRDCAWLVNFVKREARPTFTRAGFSGNVEATFSLAVPSMLRTPDCAGGTGRSVTSFSTVTLASAAADGRGREEFSPSAFAAINAALRTIAHSRNRSELDAAIGNAAAAARTLSSADAAAVHAVLSVAQGSATYWSTLRPKSAQLSMFATLEGSDWDEFVAFVGADATACGATLGFFRYFSSAIPLNGKIAICGAGAVVGSAAHFLS